MIKIIKISNKAQFDLNQSWQSCSENSYQWLPTAGVDGQVLVGPTPSVSRPFCCATQKGILPCGNLHRGPACFAHKRSKLLWMWRLESMSFSTISEVFMPFAVEFSTWWSSLVGESRSKKSGIDRLCQHLKCESRRSWSLACPTAAFVVLCSCFVQPLVIWVPSWPSWGVTLTAMLHDTLAWCPHTHR